MKFKDISALRYILFVAGAVLLGLVIRYVLPTFLLGTDVLIFLIVGVILIYFVLLFPVVFSFLTSDGIIVGGAVYYRGAWVFTVLTGGLMWLTLVSHRVRTLHIILGVVILFIFALYVLVSFSAAAHAENVKATEAQKKAVLDLLKAQAAETRMRANDACADGEVRAAVGKLADNLRYLSPSGAPEAQQLEQQLLEKLQALDLNGGDAAAQLQDMDKLYRRRKSIY